MKNENFIKTSLAEKRSKLARVIKSKTSLSDSQIIEAVGRIDLSKQYSIKKVSKDNFKKQAVNSEKTINKTGKWEEKIQTIANILIEAENGGVCLIERTHIGCLDLAKSEKTYEILVY